MSRIRHEHRTLPVLIALGVLLGAGLALASPAGHGRANHPSESGSASPIASPVLTSSPSPVASAASSGPSTSRDPAARCDRPVGVPGWATGREPLAHAIHVLASRCGDRGQGVENALDHLHDNQGRHGGHGNPHPGANGHHPHGGRHHGSNGGGQGGSDGGSNGGSHGGSTGGDGDGSNDGSNGGVDVVHGNGRDGEHGKDTHDAGSGNGGSGNDAGGTSASNTPSGGASTDGHGNDGAHRPLLPAAASDRARPNR